MQAKRLIIEERLDDWDVGIASLDRFRYREGETVDAEVVLRSNITPYCLDDKNRRVIFTETNPDADLHEPAFYHSAQSQEATCLYAVSYDAVNQLADQVGTGFKRLIWVHSVGRCGSTLLSRALGRVPTIQSFSEPDIYTQVVFLRSKNGKRDDEFIKLMRSCTRLLYKPTETSDTLALKVRGQCIEIGSLLMEAFPNAKNVYIYRHAETWAQSSVRAFGILDKKSEMSKRWGKLTPKNIKMLLRMSPLMPNYMLRTCSFMLNPLQFMALMWVSSLQRYQELETQGIKMFATRFTDLTDSPRSVLTALFEWCDLPLSGIELALSAFERDSQVGSSLARDKVRAVRPGTLTEKQLAMIGKVLACYGFDSDYTLPGSYAIPDSNTVRSAA